MIYFICVAIYAIIGSISIYNIRRFSKAIGGDTNWDLAIAVGLFWLPMVLIGFMLMIINKVTKYGR